MRIGVAVTPSASAPANGNLVDDLVDRVREAASSDLDSVWLGQRFDYDSIGLAGIIARDVPDIEVATSAVPIFARHPVLVSSQAQTSQAAARGRYVLTLGLGAKSLVEGAFGITHDRPIRRLREFLTMMRSLLTEGHVEFRGDILSGTTPMSTSVLGAQPPPPLLVAAMGPQALRAAGELADGTVTFMASPKVVEKEIVPVITAAAEAAGRPSPRVVTCVPGVLTEDVDAARTAAARQLAFYGQIPSYRRVLDLAGASDPVDVAAIGDERTVSTMIRQYADAGATDVVFGQTDTLGDADRLRTWASLPQLA